LKQNCGNRGGKKHNPKHTKSVFSRAEEETQTLPSHPFTDQSNRKMAPKKKKLNPQPPSKFGIQHFFDRASQKHHHLQPHTTTTAAATAATTTADSPQQPDEGSPQTRFNFSPGMVAQVTH